MYTEIKETEKLYKRKRERENDGRRDKDAKANVRAPTMRN